MNVVLLWHLHQPYYVNPLTRTAMMPWVRLHSVKGYLDMIDLVTGHAGVRVNFNFTPVLVRQIEELVRGEVRDLWEQWSRCPAAELDEQQQRGILENFFKINAQTLIRPYPRYAELWQQRGTGWHPERMAGVQSTFDEQDYRDLQTWYNLAWCGHAAERRFPRLTELKKKGASFTEEEKNAVLDIHAEILSLILPLYREASSRGQIEISTSPYFHPIMPLVYDTALAHRCQPKAPLPPRFTAPEDVRAQLQLAQDQHARVFGTRARGLWPSEGAMAPEIIPLLQEAGLEYFCTDEGLLFRSLENDPLWQGRKVDHLELFQGWRVRQDGTEIKALFRERPLSDFIGFSASQNDSAQAADHILYHLDHLSKVAPAPEACVCLALDGENAWEAFADGGERFLSLLYQGLSERPHLATRRLGDYFDQFPPRAELSRLHTGSWINSDFDIWIGDPEENRAWEWLGQTRNFLVGKIAQQACSTETAQAAWWEIYAAEGSDWFWWYGPDFTTDCDFLFDELFRTHLRNVFLLLGAEPPAYLDIPICLPNQVNSHARPHGYIRPALSGKLENFFDWAGAGKFDVVHQQTAMYQSDKTGQAVVYGFDHRHFYLRLDLQSPPETVQVQFLSPPTRLTAVALGNAQWQTDLQLLADPSSPKSCSTQAQARWDQFFLLVIPQSELGWRTGQTVEFFVVLRQNGLVSERYPERGAIDFTAPTLDFEASQWFI